MEGAAAPLHPSRPRSSNGEPGQGCYRIEEEGSAKHPDTAVREQHLPGSLARGVAASCLLICPVLLPGEPPTCASARLPMTGEENPFSTARPGRREEVGVQRPHEPLGEARARPRRAAPSARRADFGRTGTGSVSAVRRGPETYWIPRRCAPQRPRGRTRPGNRHPEPEDRS